MNDALYLREEADRLRRFAEDLHHQPTRDALIATAIEYVEEADRIVDAVLESAR